MESISWRDSTLTLRDGINLVSRLWIPKGDGPWPALLMRQPYGRQLASSVTYAHPSWWANHGYLVVIQDVRGQGDSEGQFNGFTQEAADTSQTHAWVRSLPECNGKLGTYGFSYQGLTQLIAEPGTPPPDCMAPAMTGLSEKEHWSCDGEAFWWHLGIGWGLQLAALQAKRNCDNFAWDEIRQSLEDGSYLREGPSLLKRHDQSGMALKWLQCSIEHDTSWTLHKPLKTWLRKPMLLLGGWWDPHLRGILDLYQKSKLSGGSPELHIGPATHLQWWEDAQSTQLNFFNLHLKSCDSSNQKTPKNLFWNLTSKEWQTSKSSTLADKQKLSNWGLTSDGLACLDFNSGVLEPNSHGHGSINLVHDPWRPAPSIGGHLSPKPGPAERSEIDKRSDVATFTSYEFLNNQTIEGIPTLRLIVWSDQEGFDICVALSKANKEETKIEQLSTGFLRVLGPKAKQPIEHKVILQAILADLKAGEKLRLSIAGAAWPAIGVNPGHLRQPCGASNSACLIVTIKMELTNSSLDFLPLLSC